MSGGEFGVPSVEGVRARGVGAEGCSSRGLTPHPLHGAAPCLCPRHGSPPPKARVPPTGERGAKGDPGAPGVGLRGEMGPPGIPGREGARSPGWRAWRETPRLPRDICRERPGSTERGQERDLF